MPSNQKNYSHVIWDWNGTLLNDADWCLHVLNHMLFKRGMPTLSGMKEYHKVFCFPIIQYYENVGFDFRKEPFESLANEFITLYHSDNSGGCRLHPHAVSVLQNIHDRHVTQIILSASETNNLMNQISEFDIIKYFDAILGISDIYARTKIEVGLNYISQGQVKRAVLIGDTEHDYETAAALGIDCLLVSSGHQSKEKLSSCNVPVLEDISDVLKYIG